MKVILVDAVYAFVIKKDSGVFHIYDEMYKMLEGFLNRKILLTGANDEQFKKFGLNKMPYKVFTLKHNPEKSNPEYYRKMLKHFGLGVEDVIYFEHNSEAVESAESIGIKTYFWDSKRQPLRELSIFLERNI